jgi:heme/copper-type cytochrome/quinol oxidase subunit 4
MQKNKKAQPLSAKYAISLFVFGAIAVTQMYLTLQLNFYLHNSENKDGYEYPGAKDFGILVIFAVFWSVLEQISNFFLKDRLERNVKG